MANRMLREALLPHNAEAWPELVKQLAILGALVARAELGQGTLTLSGIKGKCRGVVFPRHSFGHSPFLYL